jgi:hypothetical protein
MRPADRVLERLNGVERRNGYHMALCPAHDDQTPSLSITEGDDGPTERLRIQLLAKFGTYHRTTRYKGQATRK